MGFINNLMCLTLLPMLVRAKFHQTPQSQVVILGETVTLRCAFPLPVVTTYWLKGFNHISHSRQILPNIGGKNSHRYSIVGNERNGEYSLKIVDVKVEDAGDYRCAYIASSGGLTSEPATINVIVPPKADFPVCLSTPDPGPHKPGSTVELNCISLGGVPRANLTWTRNDIELGNVTFDNNKITRVLTPDDNGVEFTCTATSPAMRKHRTCSIMPMKITPSPMIKGSANSSLVGDNFTASCHSDGIPAIGSYSWFMDGRPIDFQNPRFFAINHHIKIHSLTKNDNNAILTCMVTTTLGLTGNYSLLLKVQQPTTTASPTTIQLTERTKSVTNSYPIKNVENEAESGVEIKNHSSTNVTRYNMKLILALIFGMLIFIFIIVLMTLTYFFASHTTRPRQKEGGYEETSQGPNFGPNPEEPNRVSKARDFPHYPQTYVSQEIQLSPDDPLVVGSADFNDQSFDPGSSNEIEFEMKDSQEKMTDEQKIRHMHAMADPVDNQDLERVSGDAVNNDATVVQDISLEGGKDHSSETTLEQPQRDDNTGCCPGYATPIFSPVASHLDEQEKDAMTSNEKNAMTPNADEEMNTEPTQTSQNEPTQNSQNEPTQNSQNELNTGSEFTDDDVTHVNVHKVDDSEDISITRAESLQTVVAESNTVMALDLSEEID